MYHHLSVYSESLALVSNSDVNAAVDEILSTRNNHLIFSEQFNLIAAYAASSTLTRMRFGNIALQQKGIPHIYPIGRSDTVPDLPVVSDMRDAPLQLPMNEEITLEATTDAAGPVIANAVLWLAKPSWNMNLPPGQRVSKVRATATVIAGAASSWTPLANLVFERDLFNGNYAVVGANVRAANAIAFRLYFKTQPLSEGRQLRPGGLVQDALNVKPWREQFGGLGEWGRFHTFEPPMIQLFDDTAGGTYEVMLDLMYLGS